MKQRPPLLTEFIILPEIIVTMVYVVWARIYSIWVCATCDLTGPGPHRLISLGQYLGITGFHVGLGTALLLAGVRARRSHPSLRRGHIASLLLAAYALGRGPRVW